MIIPNKKGVEILVKKIFKLLFPFDEKIVDPEIPDPGKIIKEQFEIILLGLIPDNKKVKEQFLNKLYKHNYYERNSILETVGNTPHIKVSREEAFTFTKRAAREEGLFIGISSVASLAEVNQKLADVPKGSRILTFCYDTGERYLSVEGLF